LIKLVNFQNAQGTKRRRITYSRMLMLCSHHIWYWYRHPDTSRERFDAHLLWFTSRKS